MCTIKKETDNYGRDAYQRDTPDYSGSYFLSYYTEKDHKKHKKIAAEKAQSKVQEVENLD
jgi:hypothetical protein